MKGRVLSEIHSPVFPINVISEKSPTLSSFVLKHTACLGFFFNRNRNVTPQWALVPYCYQFRGSSSNFGHYFITITFICRTHTIENCNGFCSKAVANQEAYWNVRFWYDVDLLYVCILLLYFLILYKALCMKGAKQISLTYWLTYLLTSQSSVSSGGCKQTAEYDEVLLDN